MRRFSNNSRNFGCSSNFLPGYSGIYFAKAGESFTCVLVPLSALLDVGVNVDSYEKFCDTENGAKLVGGKMIVIHLAPWDLLYVPVGYAVHSFHTELNVKNVKNFTPGTSIMMHVPLTLPLAPAGSSVSAYVKKLNADYMALKEGSMWKDRCAFAESLMPQPA
jgi:hypothetical protein